MRCSASRLIALAALVLTAAPSVAQAQGYPTHAMTVVVPFPAGGPSDVVARIVAEAMSRSLGQSMVIENVGDAGGTITRTASPPPPQTAIRCWPGA